MKIKVIRSLLLAAALMSLSLSAGASTDSDYLVECWGPNASFYTYQVFDTMAEANGYAAACTVFHGGAYMVWEVLPQE